MLIYSTLTVVAIFALLQAAFGSWRLATLSMLMLPMALIGGVIAAYASSGVISLGSLVGFLTILGIAARRHPADKPLPASGEIRGRGLRARPGAARRSGSGWRRS